MTVSKETPRNHVPFLLFVNLYVFSYLIGFFRLAPDGQEWLRNGANLGTMLIAALVALLAWRRLKGRERRVWMWLAGGMVIWLVAEVTWGLYDLLLFPQAPDFSLADIFWLLGYVAVGEAVLLYLADLPVDVLPCRKWLLMVGGFVPPLLIFGALLWPVRGAAVAPETLIAALYPALDLLLATLGFVTLWETPRKVWWCPWLLIGAALLLWAFSDAWYWVLLSFRRFGLNPRSVLAVDIPDTLGNLVMAYAGWRVLRADPACQEEV